MSVTGPAVATRASDLVGFDRLRPLVARRNGPGLRLLGAHLVAVGAGTAAIAWSRGTWFLAPAWILTGVVIAHLFALQHETTHTTAFASRRLNRVVAVAAGSLLGIAPTLFRLEHLAHHAATQDPDADPELLAVPRSVAGWLWQLGTVPFWAYQWTTLRAHVLGRLLPGEAAWIPSARRPAVFREARLLVAGWLVVLVVPLLLGSTDVIVFWLVPRVLGEPVMRAARLAEHAGRPQSADITTNTRTLDVVWPLRLLAWNMPYHAEHHAMPSVPFHALPELRRVLAGRLAGPSGGYLAAHRELLGAIRGRRP